MTLEPSGVGSFVVASLEWHQAGTCHAERSEASRSLNRRALFSVNEILRRSAPQNDIKRGPVILDRMLTA